MMMTTPKFGILLTAIVLVHVGISACSAPPTFDQFICDPKIASLADPGCRNDADAGTDAETDATPDGASANDNPGLQPSVFNPPNYCTTGRCIPDPIGEETGLWNTVPISLWIGPIDQVPEKCPDDPVFGVPTEIFRRYDQLVAPPAMCSPCSCAPSEGTCSGVPETLELRAGKCGQNDVATVPFDAPATWDGSCTNANTIAAGANCPAGSQTLCTQSVHSTALPAPANDACKPSVSIPSVELKTSWEIGALGCRANTEPQTCGADTLKSHCVNDPGPAWLQCTYRAGVHEKCPDNYQYARHVLYPKEPIDNRGCSACQCGAPMDSACLGALSLSTDGACSAEYVKLEVGSMGPNCYNFLMPGVGIGSKAIVNRTYLSGVCASSGGESIGAAVPNDTKDSGVVTFCCQAPAPPSEPPPR